MVRDRFDVSHGGFMHGRNRLDMGNIRICGVYRIGRLVTYQMAGDETMSFWILAVIIVGYGLFAYSLGVYAGRGRTN